MAGKPRRRKRSQITLPESLKCVNLNAAGIDIGATMHFVAVPADGVEEPVRCFKSFTEDLGALADWLADCGIDTVAMEATGVYWIPLFELLVERGFEVKLVNPHQAGKQATSANRLKSNIKSLLRSIDTIQRKRLPRLHRLRNSVPRLRDVVQRLKFKTLAYRVLFIGENEKELVLIDTTRDM